MNSGWLLRPSAFFEGDKGEETLMRVDRLSTGVLWVLVTTIIAVAFYFLRPSLRLRPRTSRRPNDKAERRAGKREQVDPWMLTESALTDGRWDEAISLAYRAVLEELEAGGLVPSARSRTNWEYLTQLQRSPQAASVLPFFRKLNLVFDRVHYGNEKAGTEESRSFVADALQIRTLVSGISG